jgi:hypothetical protein
VGLLPGLVRVKEQKRIAGIESLIHEADQVSDDLSVFLIIDTADRLVARVGDLLGIF